MPDQNQSQLTGSQLSELHGLATQMQAANDPRTQRLWNFIQGQTDPGDGNPKPQFTMSRTPLKVTSWLEDLENDLWGSKQERGSQSADASQDAEGDDEAPNSQNNRDDSVGNPSSTTELNPDKEEMTGNAQPQQAADDPEPPADTATDGAVGNDEPDPQEWDLEQGRYTPASAEDIANGNYIKVGFRHLLKGPKFAYHSYIQIPVIGQDGKPAKEKQLEKWGVLGDPNSSENQQVRNDPRNDPQPGEQAKEVYVKVTPEQREALRERMKYFKDQDENGNFIHPCPVCGPNYHLLRQNSNSFVYNMLFWNPAGMIWAPKPPRWTVKYGENMGDIGWYK